MHNCVPGALIHFTVAQMGSHASQLLLGSMLFLLSCSPPQLHPSISSKTTCLKFLCTFFFLNQSILWVISSSPKSQCSSQTLIIRACLDLSLSLVSSFVQDAGLEMGNSEGSLYISGSWFGCTGILTIFSLFSHKKRTLILISSQRNGKALLNCCHYFFHLLK